MKHIFTIFFTVCTFLSIAQKSKYRRILIFAPDTTNALLKHQNQIFQNEVSACKERDIIIENYSIKTEKKYYFDKYQVSIRDFTVLLIGKDGFVKFRSKEVVEAKRFYALIDAMPMRKDELRKNKKH
jgi:hypothetical protein